MEWHLKNVCQYWNFICCILATYDNNTCSCNLIPRNKKRTSQTDKTTSRNKEYEVCSKSIRIGIVLVVHWVGCVCNQSWYVRTCLSNSWHKLQVAAFAQLAVVCRGWNTCVYVIAIFTMCGSTEQRICIKFCFKIGKPATETYQLLQQAYGEYAMGRTQVFDWFRRFNHYPTNAQSPFKSASDERTKSFTAPYTHVI